MRALVMTSVVLRYGREKLSEYYY